MGILWDLVFEPIWAWSTKKWVTFIVRKQRVWTPGTPFPSYFGEIRATLLYATAAPSRVFRAVLPVRNPRQSRVEMVPGQRGQSITSYRGGMS